MQAKVRALIDGVDEFIGIDHHKKFCQVIVKDREGNVLKRGRVRTNHDAFAKFLGEANGALRMATYEAGPRYRPLHRWLEEMVDESVMANPGRLKLISETAYKDDDIDAEKLVDLLMLGMIPQYQSAVRRATPWQAQSPRAAPHFGTWKASPRNAQAAQRHPLSSRQSR